MQERPDLLRRRVRAVDDRDSGPMRSRTSSSMTLAKQRIVRAPEHDDVDPRSRERLEVAPDGEPRHFARRPALLGERHEQRRRLTDHLGARRELRDRARVGPRRDGPAPSRARRCARVASPRTAARAPGSTTPSTGMSSSTRSRSGATALTVLHAMTSALTPAVDQVPRAARART